MNLFRFFIFLILFIGLGIGTAQSPTVVKSSIYSRLVVSGAQPIPVLVISYGYTRADPFVNYAAYSELNKQLNGSKVTYNRVYINLLNTNSEDALRNQIAAITQRIASLQPTYIIVNEMSAHVESLHKFLEEKFKGKYFTVGFDSHNNLILAPDFAKFFDFIQEAKYSDNFQVVYLANNYNIANLEDDLYLKRLNELKEKYKFSLQEIQVKTVKNLRQRLQAVAKENKKTVIVTNLKYLVDETTNDVIYGKRLLREVKDYAPHALIIQMGNEPAHYLVYRLDEAAVAQYLDTFIVAKHYGLNTGQPININQPLGLDMDVMELNKLGVFNNINLSELRNLLSK